MHAFGFPARNNNCARRAAKRVLRRGLQNSPLTIAQYIKVLDAVVTYNWLQIKSYRTEMAQSAASLIVSLTVGLCLLQLTRAQGEFVLRVVLVFMCVPVCLLCISTVIRVVFLVL